MKWKVGLCVSLDNIKDQRELMHLLVCLKADGFYIPQETLRLTQLPFDQLKLNSKWIGVNQHSDVMVYDTSPWYYSDKWLVDDEEDYELILTREELERYLK